jgi:hypothetical protein
MRTVIFRAYRANLDAAAQKKLRAELKTLTGPACVKDFYGAYFSDEDLKAHSGVLFNDYLISVFRGAAQIEAHCRSQISENASVMTFAQHAKQCNDRLFTTGSSFGQIQDPGSTDQANDEVPHYEWMVGLMRFVAKIVM